MVTVNEDISTFKGADMQIIWDALGMWKPIFTDLVASPSVSEKLKEHALF